MICPGCGTESEKRVCDSCDERVQCINCSKIFRKGQGLIDAPGVCPACIEVALTPQLDYVATVDEVSPYEEYGFDYPWEK